MVLTCTYPAEGSPTLDVPPCGSHFQCHSSAPLKPSWWRKNKLGKKKSGDLACACFCRKRSYMCMYPAILPLCLCPIPTKRTGTGSWIGYFNLPNFTLKRDLTTINGAPGKGGTDSGKHDTTRSNVPPKSPVELLLTFQSHVIHEGWGRWILLFVVCSSFFVGVGSFKNKKCGKASETRFAKQKFPKLWTLNSWCNMI